ncbi:MAG: hypothetical protein IJC05_03450 [Phascolarctobacterium sp.]|nr:hypothetical protein [Phascolarctobacterium sp.]MBQ3540781.1 hypothetical protein [Phascolarctobacterium sp.]MBQ7021244.1 hypothetical protein [Phascolarctobacterium sp.]MBR1976005.1 hypothetical protein [Phascolarctobacterium sp.]MBR2070952.1 hypothetical protein [Phascolarctobacterium sp.]
MDKRTKNEREYIKAMSALSTVSSLALMTVFDFILAYWGGDWLDNYFQTGDHTFRLICIVIAIITLFLTFFKMIYTLILDKDEDE